MDDIRGEDSYHVEHCKREEVGRYTFSSSLRFSLRFLRRLAISARRMACSSAVKCFLICGSNKTLSARYGMRARQGSIKTYP